MMREALDTFITVIMPAFNAERTIEQSVQSILSQTHQNLELIIVDDSSRDATCSVAQKLAQSDSRIKVIQNEENLGVSGARNRGIAEAKAEWIAFADSDDMWDARKLEEQCKMMEKDPHCPFFFTGSAFVNDQDQSFSYRLNVPERITYKNLLKQNLISCSSVLIRKELLQRYPMKRDAMIHEDYATWLQILRDIPYAVGIDEPLLIYRLSRGSKSGNKLKAAYMQWRTYQYVGLTGFQMIRYFGSYAIRSLKKYISIHNSIQENGEMA